eukprot:s510_g24.t1
MFDSFVVQSPNLAVSSAEDDSFFGLWVGAGDLHSPSKLRRRLCKTKSLRRAGYAQNCNYDQWLEWQALNLYDITDEVIKKYILYHDRKWGVDESDPIIQKRYSWAELVSAEPQRPQLMISHWWGGRFSDFMTTVDTVVSDRALSICTSLWVCTFANNQFGESFGSEIIHTPFVRAIESAEATILIVDRDAGSLTRSWCLELHCTILREKELQLYTSTGMVGSAAVSSGPLVDAISRWDVRKSHAAETAYKRQIMNFIAEVPETCGLQTDDAGNLHVNGRPQLAKAEDCDCGNWGILSSHSDAFEALNMDVRVSVLGRIGQRKKITGCSIPYVGHRGITLGQLRTFARKARRQVAKLHPKTPWDHFTVAQICELETEKQRCSYVELVADGPQIPDYCVNYQFGMFFSDEWFAEALLLKDTVDLRACCYENDSLTVDRAQCECHSFLITAGSICKENQAVPCSLEPMAEPFSMSRAWRLYSLECATRLGQDVYVACNTGVMACTKLFPNGHSKFGAMDPRVTETWSTVRCDRWWQSYRSYCFYLFHALRYSSISRARIPRATKETMFHLNISRVSCSSEECAKDILYFINNTYGSCGQVKLKRRMQRWAACHLVPFAASGVANCLQQTTLEELLTLPGFSIHSELAKCSLGQSSLHEAVAADSIEAAKLLLAHGCLLNATDSMQETPLHYAAIRGNAEMIELLVDARADLHMESKYGENAWDVAKQGVAAFLQSHDTSGIPGLLHQNWLKLGFEALGGGRTKRSLSETSSRPSGFVMAGGAFRRAASHGRNIASSLGAVIRVPGRQRSAPDSTTLNPAVSLEVMKVRPPEGKATFANSATGRWRQRAYQGPEEPGRQGAGQEECRSFPSCMWSRKRKAALQFASVERKLNPHFRENYEQEESMTSSSATDLEAYGHSQPSAETELDYESDDAVLDEVMADAVEDLELEDAFDGQGEQEEQNETKEQESEKPGTAANPDNLDTLPYEPVQPTEPEQAEGTARGVVGSSGEESADEADQKANCNKETHAESFYYYFNRS